MSVKMVTADRPALAEQPALFGLPRRWPSRAGLLLVVLAVLPLLMGPTQQTQTKVVEAEKFVLRDQSGKIRAELGFGAGGPSLALLDAEGHCRVRLAVLADGSSRLALYDKDGHDRAVLLVRSEGEPQLDLATPQTKELVATSVSRPASSPTSSALTTPAPVVSAVPEVAPRLRAAEGFYRRLCQSCHGSDGQGRRTRTSMPQIPNFADAAWHTTRSDGQLTAVILHGRGDEMPSFDDRLTLEQTRDLVAYLRAFAPASVQRVQHTPGDFDSRLRELQSQWEELERQLQELAPMSRK